MSQFIHSFSKDFFELADRRLTETALITGQDIDAVEMSYAELATSVRRCCALFDQKGISAGSAIMAIMPNAVDTLVLFYAALASGVQYAPIACTATTDEVGRWLNLVRPSACFVTDLMPSNLAALLASMDITCINIDANSRFEWLPSDEAQRDVATGKILLGTSGTTGVPKAMVIDGDVLWSSGRAFVDFHSLSNSGARFWNYLPVSYLGGLFNLGLIPLAAQGSVVMDETFSGKTYLTYWQSVQRYGIDTLWLVPTIVRGLVSLGRVAKRRTVDVDRVVKRCFLGTAPIDLATKREFEIMFGRPLLENFALSETTFLTSEIASTIANRSEGSTGEPLPYVSLSFRQVADAEMENEAQEILVKTPFLLDGYLDESGTVSREADVNGFFPTGDLGYLNASGALVVTGRIRDIIKKGGYFIALREIEILAESLTGVREAAAVPVRHDFYGESYMLFIIPEGAADADFGTRVGRDLRGRLAQYRWPEEVRLVEELPKTASGKVRKTVLALKGAEK